MINRRAFVHYSINQLAKLAIATTGVYVVGSASKELDGSIVAGAKGGWCGADDGICYPAPSPCYDNNVICNDRSPFAFCVTHCP
jgi:hypothetical protein